LNAIMDHKRILSNLQSMLRARNYDVPEVEQTGQNPIKPCIIFNAYRPDGTLVMAFMPQQEKIGVRDVRTYFTQMSNNKCLNALIVTKQSISSWAKNEINSKAPLIRIELFTYSNLCVNIIDSALHTPHVRLSLEEAADILKQYNATPVQLPVLNKNDAVARYYDFRMGDIVKIGPRLWGNLPAHYYYRIVK